MFHVKPSDAVGARPFRLPFTRVSRETYGADPVDRISFGMIPSPLCYVATH